MVRIASVNHRLSKNFDFIVITLYSGELRMRKYRWIVMISLIGYMVSFMGCTKFQKKSMPVVSDKLNAKPVDVLIYTGSVSWITLENARTEAKTTNYKLESNGIRVAMTESEETLRNWMVETTANGAVNVCILYGILPTSIYAPGNTEPEGSIVENWIETTDGDTILNQGDYFGYYSSDETPNYKAPLQNIMDLPDIDINVEYFEQLQMHLTDSGKTLTPSLVNFDSDRPFPIEQLGSEWYAEKIFASNSVDDKGNFADPIILRDGNRGRLAMVYQTHHGDNPKGEVAAEIIINYLLAK